MQLEDRPYERRVKKSVLIDHAMRLHDGSTDCVIQAGGHVGVWPNRLTEYFDKVYTFEPHPDNYQELLKNTEGCDQIHPFSWGLGDSVRFRSLKSSTKSSGMHHIDPDGDGIPTHVISIDWFCDRHKLNPGALFLDVEGYELFVLHGAESTIRRNYPLIVCEENEACKRYGLDYGVLAKWLAGIGYEMKRKYKKDLIFCRT